MGYQCTVADLTTVQDLHLLPSRDWNSRTLCPRKRATYEDMPRASRDAFKESQAKGQKKPRPTACTLKFESNHIWTSYIILCSHLQVSRHDRTDCLTAAALAFASLSLTRYPNLLTCLLLCRRPSNPVKSSFSSFSKHFRLIIVVSPSPFLG